jgi:hypothetical protein
MFNKYKNLSASASIKAGAGYVSGIIVNSHTTGTLKLWDSLSATGTIICNTITFNNTDRTIFLLELAFTTGLFATIGGTAADITVVYK